jgi:hypothetical protein
MSIQTTIAITAIVLWFARGYVARSATKEVCCASCGGDCASVYKSH